MKIAIDITTLLDQYSNRGIGTYTKQLVKHLIVNQIHEWHLIGFKDFETNLEQLNLDFEAISNHVKFHSLGEIQLSGLKNIQTNKSITKILNTINPDIHFTINLERYINTGDWKKVITIHDLIPYETTSYSQKSPIHNLVKGGFYENQLAQIRGADLLIVNSNTVRDIVIKELNVPQYKIKVDLLGIDEDLINLAVSDYAIELEKPYLLYFGGLESNKNVVNVVKGYAEFAQSNDEVELVIITSDHKGKRKLEEITKILKIDHRIRFIANLERDDLKSIIESSIGFVHLSTSEGFGLAVLENLSLGKPCLISNIKVYKELYSEFALLVDPKDIGAIAEGMRKMVNGKVINVDIKQLRAKFDWKNNANNMVKAIENLVNSESNSKNIAFVIPYFYPFKGGAENYTLDIASRLASDMNNHIEVFTSKINKNDENFEEYKHIFIRRSHTWIKQYYLKFYPGLFEQIMDSDADIFHVQGFGFIWQDFCLILKKLFDSKNRNSGRKFVNTPHGPFMARKNYSVIARILRWLFVGVQRIYLNWLYDEIIAVNPNQTEWINKEYGIDKSKVKFLPIGIGNEHFSKIGTDTVLSEYPELKNKLVISYLGRFHKYKGVLELIESFYKLKQQNISSNLNPHLILMGSDAGALEEMKELIRKYELEGEVSIFTSPDDQTRDAILELSQIFVFPSEWEAYGIAMLEAMAHGNAIISTQTEGGIYLIKQENGLLYNFGDIDNLTESIIVLLQDDQLRQSLIQNNIQKARELRWDNIWPEYQKFYDSL